MRWGIVLLGMALVTVPLTGCVESGDQLTPTQADDPRTNASSPAPPRSSGAGTNGTDASSANTTTDTNGTTPGTNGTDGNDPVPYWPERDWRPAVRNLASKIQRALDADRPVELTVQAVEDTPYGLQGRMGEERTFEVALNRSSVLPSDAWAEIGRTKVPMPFVRAYEGHVVGEPDDLVRLTYTRQWVRGTVHVDDAPPAQAAPTPSQREDRTYLLRMGTAADGVPGDAEGGGEGGQRTSADPASARSAGGAGEGGVYPSLRGDVRSQEPCGLAMDHAPQPVLDGASLEPITYRLVLDGDRLFRNVTGRDGIPLLVAFANEVDGIYADEVGIRIEVAGVHVHTEEDPLPVDASGSRLSALETYWNDRSGIARDSVHLVTGADLGYGVANCLGAAGFPQQAYSLTPLVWAEEFAVFHRQAMAHELGHLLDAAHRYGNHAESTLATVMIQGYTPGVRPAFSTLSNSVMRAWASEHLAG